ncbi:hypothetical protein CKAH01_17513 [Colletotrichum kahawae]|uniref:Uncharacterized protein n=1 Tax=Colletotrichum kahawae TaxID=34407 RepID=A0AAE0D3H1_COLKA|nr:hypothetical protein CKAH01_17513 [Colletotrichum kahawae]
MPVTRSHIQPAPSPETSIRQRASAQNHVPTSRSSQTVFFPALFACVKPAKLTARGAKDEEKKSNAGTPKVSGQLPAQIIPYSSCHRISSLGRNHSKLPKNLQHPRSSPIVGMDSPPPGPSGSDPPPEHRQPPFLGPWP